jgi:hypothetical protein
MACPSARQRGSGNPLQPTFGWNGESLVLQSTLCPLRGKKMVPDTFSSPFLLVVRGCCIRLDGRGTKPGKETTTGNGPAGRVASRETIAPRGEWLKASSDENLCSGIGLRRTGDHLQ